MISVQCGICGIWFGQISCPIVYVAGAMQTPVVLSVRIVFQNRTLRLASCRRSDHGGWEGFWHVFWP